MEKILALVAEINDWTDGDQEAFNKLGEVPIDGNFVFVARKKKIAELKAALKKLKK